MLANNNLVNSNKLCRYDEMLASNEASIDKLSAKIESLKSDLQARTKDIRQDLEQCSKNPYLYTQRKILAVASTVVIVAAVAIASYFTMGKGLPFFCNMIAKSGEYSLTSFLGVFGFTLSFSPLVGLGSIQLIHKNVWSNKKSDTALLEKEEKSFKVAEKSSQLSIDQLKENNKQLKADLITEIASKQESLNLHIEATGDEFNSHSWNATLTICPSFKELTTLEKQKAAWLNSQANLVNAKNELPQSIKDLKRQLEKFSEIN